MNPLAIAIFTLIVFLILLIKASDYFTEAAEKVGLHLGIPSFVVGLTIVALGTSLPELVTSITAAHSGNSEIVVGNVIGSNITNILLVLGAAAFFSKGLSLKEKIPWIDKFLFFSSSLLITLVVIYDHQIIRPEGLGCLFFLLVYLIYNARKHTNTPVISRPIPEKGRVGWLTICVLLISPIFIFIAAIWTIEAVVLIARELRVGEEIIAFTAIALGTSLPELSVSLVAARKGNADIAVGNIVGSNIFNCALVLGVVPFFGATIVRPNFMWFGLAILWLSTILLLVIIKDKTVSRREGGTLLLFYVIFIAVIFLVRTIFPGFL